MLISLICVFILLPFFPSQTKPNQEIVGRWEAVETTRGGLGSRLEFNRDGSITFTFGPLLHGTYKLEGSHLTTNTVQSDGKQTTAIQEVEIQGDTLIQSSGEMKGMKIPFDRITSRDPSSSPIVGRWRQRIPVTTYDFRRDGSVFVSDSSGSKWGGETLVTMTYKLDRNRLTMTITSLNPDVKERITQSVEGRIDGDTLIQKVEGREYRMHRLNQSQPDKSSIIGKWIMDIPEGTDQRMPIVEYKKNGEWIFRMSLGTGKGSYSIDGDLLTTTLDIGTRVSRFRFEKGFLFLKSPPDGGAEDRFKRIEK